MDIQPRKAVFSAFADSGTVERAVAALLGAGFTKEQILVVGGGDEMRNAMLGHWRVPDYELGGMRPEGEIEGTTIGGLIGLLEGCALLAVPGLGLVAILGPIVAAMVGGSIGYFLGWLYGTANADQISMNYRGRLAAGDTILVVNVPTELAHKVENTLEPFGPEMLNSYSASEIEPSASSNAYLAS